MNRKEAKHDLLLDFHLYLKIAREIRIKRKKGFVSQRLGRYLSPVATLRSRFRAMILLSIILVFCQSFKPIYTTNKNDIRIKNYQDSIKAWEGFRSEWIYTAGRLMACKNIKSYLLVADSLKIEHTHTIRTNNQGELIDINTNKPQVFICRRTFNDTINHWLSYEIHSYITSTFIDEVAYPVQPVYYRPALIKIKKNRVNLIDTVIFHPLAKVEYWHYNKYIHEKTNSIIYIDSSKTIKKIANRR